MVVSSIDPPWNEVDEYPIQNVILPWNYNGSGNVEIVSEQATITGLKSSMAVR